jgi:hypothetical protein
MTFKFFVAAALFVAVPIVAFAQSDKPNAQPSKPTIEDAQKFVETISGDKDKLKAYCEIGKLHEQLDDAEEKGDAKEFEDLVAKLDSLEQQMGPDYIRVTDGLGDVDPNSAEGQKFSAVFEPLRKQCGPSRGRT